MDAMTTATQNLVVAFNNQTKATQTNSGIVTTLTQFGPVSLVVNAGQCRLVNVCVVQSGGQQVKFYNSQSLTALPANSLLYVLDANAPLGITQIGLNFSNGLCMEVGSGVSVNCTYSVIL